MRLFVDSGAFLSRWITSDQYHPVSTKIWQKIENGSFLCFTSNFIIDEVATLLARRTDVNFASKKIDLIYESGFFAILRPNLETETTALSFFKKYADQKVSFTDCTSFQLMKENKLTTAFTFDQHFFYAGFKVLK